MAALATNFNGVGRTPPVAISAGIYDFDVTGVFDGAWLLIYADTLVDGSPIVGRFTAPAQLTVEFEEDVTLHCEVSVENNDTLVSVEYTRRTDLSDPETLLAEIDNRLEIGDIVPVFDAALTS